MYGINCKKNKTSSCRINNIEVLSERLGSLKIMNEASSKTNKQSDKEISITLAPAITNNNV